MRGYATARTPNAFVAIANALEQEIYALPYASVETVAIHPEQHIKTARSNILVKFHVIAAKVNVIRNIASVTLLGRPVLQSATA